MRIFLLLFSAALLLSSCDNLVNGVVRDIDLPPHESQLAASLFLDSRDSNISAIVSSSKGIYDTGQSKSVYNAECILDVGTTNYNWSTMDQYERYTELLPDRFGAPTDSLVFTVNHPDFTSVSATQVFPSAPQVTLELNYGATQLYGEISDELVITLKDIPDVNQHYIVSIDVHFRTALSGQDTSQYYNLYWETEYPNSTPLWGQESALLLSEDGLDRNIKFSAATGINPIDFAMLHEYRVKVSALSEEMYLFYKSYSAYENANGNPFAEPVVLYSNMSNNMGCFGVSTTKRFYK
ncbi:DUF4249 domain-containing protein [bacterium]|nr:DUF4249 domain-containing protein [bacterium]MDC3400042.1 DUF4249 domain-containing protein [Schleiferiaceae bacterium]